MFDRIWLRCPMCYQAIEMQSKAGDCMLTDFVLADVPPAIMADLAGQTVHCPQCSCLWRLRAVLTLEPISL